MLAKENVFGIHKMCDTESSRYALGGVLFERPRWTKDPVAIATDGRKMIAVSWKEDDAQEYPCHQLGIGASPVKDFSAIIPAEACKEAIRIGKKVRKIAKRKPVLGNIAVGEVKTAEGSPEESIQIGATDLETPQRVETRTLQGKFPDWRGVFPQYTERDSVSVKVNPHLLIEVLKAAADNCTDVDGSASLTLTLGLETDIKTPDGHAAPIAACGCERPVLVTGATPDGNRVAGCVMPIGNGKKKRPRHLPTMPEWNPAIDADPEFDPDEEPEPNPPKAGAEVKPAEPKAEPPSREILLKELDEIRNEAFDRKNERIAQEILKAYVAFSADDAADVYSVRNLRETVERYRVAVNALPQPQAPADETPKAEPVDANVDATDYTPGAILEYAEKGGKTSFWKIVRRKGKWAWVAELPQKDGAPLYQGGDDGAVRRKVHGWDSTPTGVSVRGNGLAVLWGKSAKGGAA